MPDLASTLEHLFRQESGKILAGLISAARSFDIAEEALQEAFAAALSHWPKQGIPANPGAWLTTTAQRKLIDTVRKRRTHRQSEDQIRYETNVQTPPLASEDEVAKPCPDDRLSLVFTCCHPALPQEAQIALTLRSLCGLTTSEIARAFLISESSLAQRIVRAKRKIEQHRIRYEVPTADLLPERLAAVQRVIYLIFNEGYCASSGDSLVRRELTHEAIRLGRVLSNLLPNEAENLALLALMLLQDSRRDARADAEGNLILLEDQDRTKWDRAYIEEGISALKRAAALGQPGPYQIQAAIAAVHAAANEPKDTDWRRIATLYADLEQIHPSPVVALNRAAAVAMADSPERGLELLNELELGSFHLFHALKADLLRRLGRASEARNSYRLALKLAANVSEQRFLERRLRELEETNPD